MRSGERRERIACLRLWSARAARLVGDDVVLWKARGAHENEFSVILSSSTRSHTKLSRTARVCWVIVVVVVVIVVARDPLKPGGASPIPSPPSPEVICGCACELHRSLASGSLLPLLLLWRWTGSGPRAATSAAAAAAASLSILDS